MRFRLLLVTLLTAGVASLAGQSTYRAGVDVVSVGVTVLDPKGAPVSGLTGADFQIREDKVLQDVVYFAQLDDPDGIPLHLGLLFDTSASMEQDLTMSRAAAIKFFNSFPRRGGLPRGVQHRGAWARAGRGFSASRRADSEPTGQLHRALRRARGPLDGAAEVSRRKVS